jgi:hypothetical protein
MRLCLVFAIAIVTALMNLPTPWRASASGVRPASMSGVVYRGDRQHPVADADVELVYDHQEDKTEEGVTARTDAEGNYHFDQLLPEGYHLEVRTWHDRAEDVPCKFAKARTNEKRSAVTVTKLGDKYAELIYLNDIRLRSGQALVRDIDINCLDAGR